MAGSFKQLKKPEVVGEESGSDESSDVSDESGEEGDDMEEMVEIKEESDSEDDSYLDSSAGVQSVDTSIEMDDADVKDESEDEIASDEEHDSDADGEDDSYADDQDERSSESSDESDIDSSEEIERTSDTDDKTGLANVMAQILATPGGNEAMLSKAKKETTTKVKSEETGEFEYVDADGNVRKEIKIEVCEEEDEEQKIRKKLEEKETLMKKLKLKPDFETDHEKERKLRIIATQGVVQLFTAMEKHKSYVKELSGKKKRITDEDEDANDLKEAFLDMLDKEGEKVKTIQPQKKMKKEIKEEKVKEEKVNLPVSGKKSKWNVLADNFYKEPTLQGWDLKSDDEE